MLEPRLDVPGPWIAAGTDSELWRRFGTEFQQLHKAEVALLNGQKEDRRFRALVGFKDCDFPFGRWHIYSCIDELVKSRFNDLATNIGVTLDAPKDITPLDYWLYHVWVVLRWKAPRALDLASDGGGFILDILEGSAICCAVYATEVSEYFHSCCPAEDETAPEHSSAADSKVSARDAISFHTEEERRVALTAYTEFWNCSEAALGRTAFVNPADVSKWKKGKLPPKSGKASRLEECLKKNKAPKVFKQY